MKFFLGLPVIKNNCIRVIIDRLTKSSHFVPLRTGVGIETVSLFLGFGPHFKKLWRPS